MADTEYFKWLGDSDAVAFPFVTREIAGLRFEAPGHVASTGDKDKIKYLTESDNFKKVTKTEFTLLSGIEVEDVLETAPAGAEGGSAGSGAEGLGGNGSSTAG